MCEWLSGLDWDDVPAWISSLGAVGALIVATFAAWRAHGLFQIESGRDKEARDRDERAQADLVAAWLDKDRKFSPPNPPWYVTIANASLVPVYALRLHVLAGENQDDDGENVFRRSYPVVQPGERQSRIRNLPGMMTAHLSDDDALVQLDYLNKHKDAVIAACSVWITFRDASGVDWTRSNEGNLIRGVSGPFATEETKDTRLSPLETGDQ